MIAILVDHNIEGQAALLWRQVMSEGWPSLIEVELLTFDQVGMAVNSSDRVIWRFVQNNGMLLLTGNRRSRGRESLAQTIREENISSSLPVLTVGDPDRMGESDYRDRCVSRLMEVIFDLDIYRGVGRLFIP